MRLPGWRFEDEARRSGKVRIAGVDEVGRGSLAGPVLAAAVVLDRDRPVPGVNDSKLLTAARRAELAREILRVAVAVGIGAAGADEVDRCNVLEATRAAMRRAVEAVHPPADHLLIDAVRLPGLDVSQVNLVKGDRRSVSIAAASIVAKVVRDVLMGHYAESYPPFEFADNKGYGTSAHLEALARLGPCAIHRRSFRGVWAQGSLAFEA